MQTREDSDSIHSFVRICIDPSGPLRFTFRKSKKNYSRCNCEPIYTIYYAETHRHSLHEPFSLAVNLVRNISHVVFLPTTEINNPSWPVRDVTGNIAIELLRKLRQLIMAHFVWSLIDSRCRKHLFSPFRTMQAFRKLLDQLSSVVLISVRSCLFRLEFHFKALLIKSYIHDCTKRRWT